MSGLKPPKNKTGKKQLSVTDAFLEKKRERDLKDKTVSLKFGERFKIFICKIFRIDYQKKHQYLYRIQFKGGKLKRGDVILSRKGVFYAVAQVQGNRARIITINYLKEEFIPRGIFQIVQDPKKH